MKNRICGARLDLVNVDRKFLIPVALRRLEANLESWQERLESWDKKDAQKNSSKMTAHRKALYWLLFATLLTGCSEKKAPQPTRAYPVQIGTTETKTVPLYIEALGHVESITTIDIRSRIEGELTGVFFKQGQEVKQGDLLFTIDSKPYEAALKEAQGALEQSLANLALAQEKVKRYKILAKDEYYSQIDYETLQANLAATAALVQQN